MDLAVSLLICATAVTGTTVAEPQQQMCLANGRAYQQGELACLELPCMQPYLARCEMVLNNSSWRKVGDICPISLLVEEDPSAAQPAAGSISR